MLPITQSEHNFRTEPQLREEWGKARTTGLLAAVQQVLLDSHPIRQRPPSQNDGDKNVLLGRVYGFQEVLDIFDRLEKPLPKPPTQVPEDWGTDPKQQE